MDFGLKGRRALVLASTRGLGRAIATSLAAEGAEVVICGRDGADQAAAQIAAETGAHVHGILCDLHDRAQVDDLIRVVRQKLGGVDVLVLNGGGPPPAPAIEISGADWKLWFERMVETLIHVAGAFLPDMRARGWGRLVTVASSAAVQPLPHMALSNSLRAGLLAWNKTLAAEVAADGVTCNVILPGRIQTDRVDQLDEAKAKREGLTVDQVRKQALAGIPAARYGQPKEFGDAAAFLCSEQASYVTGTLMRVDGGYIRAV
ncbi:MAG: SDR family oxidoreductase [Alphaproteobacteria bacterium]|nr:SDR family oxidoreductase [Alphaproteobacteria bacterium]MDX5369117.1 SDR family oxidoreductase [Alphaproteobacteria bacterium]MDX5463810.1 SDR family oxidoreductase [Alphaproteobacteria bacterium]